MFKRSLAEECLALAAQSDCTLMKFGALLIKDGEVIGRGYTKKVHPCVARFQCCEYRKNIRPRGKAERCEAIHAEWAALRDTVRNGHDPSGASLVICGMGPSDEAWIREEPYASCTLCARLCALFEIKELIVQVKARNKAGWDFASLSIEQALITSFEVAFGEREIKRAR
ncbi:MAG: hypothetical protein A2806_04435 [Candidatus Terrybacteria bacterium RIFCSPHIGHO2_01_FULL_48_17]|uniref:CMP/dCMP-type deaminase domain-containing protein n=1 Tax=Candidatus Terrybacteria bacterium RIFCSPHIGHO2_01_FULL_48_17 TaxID=1802362 RepID=A0A1G2PMT6_9BACT|nr:MAG: hypothetical protein A2806_04435 [Candidatus Terrybacteria bacterium RIFCSPHIGHO2_01_FULL_48_17]OHA52853.1 MAG: hypothetical protein A3A30_03080 [Candidatus Terrybacteria bacterium RIFCSPLOWO2_01_FULL_48_14]